MFAQPLKLQQGKWYEVGATEYGGPSDPTAGTGGSIAGTDPAQGYLPAHPDSFAELSLLDSNTYPNFTFADANALNNLPYMTGLIVANNNTKKVLYKRDTGYGQGPGQTIANGQPYRLDVWWQSAAALGVTKNAVKIALAPPVGAGPLLGESSPGGPAGSGNCAQLDGQPLAPGQYANPFAHSANIAPNRIDQGVDYSATGPIGAIGDGQVTLSAPFDSGWSANGVPFSCAGGHAGAVVYRLSDGPDRGKYVYVTEGITPTVSDGQSVRAGQQIATFTGCIEIGWGSGSGDQPMAQVLGQSSTTGDPGSHSTACGNEMSQLITSLHGPAGIPQGPIYGAGC
jgi:murein DD-endopeptidase MepM/ murein hydrolase activator NlpD